MYVFGGLERPTKNLELNIFENVWGLLTGIVREGGASLMTCALNKIL